MPMIASRWLMVNTCSWIKTIVWLWSHSILMVSYLNSSSRAPEKVLKLLCWLMWVLSLSLMFPNTWANRKKGRKRTARISTPAGTELLLAHLIRWPACQWWRRWRRAWRWGGRRMGALWRTGWRSKGESGSCSLVSAVWSGELLGTTSRSSCWTFQQTGTKSQGSGCHWRRCGWDRCIN